jgi:hypothetical protein
MDDQLLREFSIGGNKLFQAHKDGEIDLHNYSTGVALEYFVSYYNAEVQNKTRGAIKVIHGYGSTGSRGEIRVRLRTYLREHSNYLRFEMGENIDSNPGYTLVYPDRLLPPMSKSIEAKIFEFCAAGKSEEKIFKEFRLYGDAEVKKALKSLQRQKKIRHFDKGKLKYYGSIKP